jgi:hypothetical protein
VKLHQLSESRQRAYLDGEPSSPLQAAFFGVATITVMFGPVLLLLLVLVSGSSNLPKGMMELVTLFALMGWFAFLLPRVDAPQAWLSKKRRLRAGLPPTPGCPDRCSCPDHRQAG